MNTTSIEILRQLVRFDTTSYKSNLDLIAFIREFLLEYGVSCALVPDQTDKKANLFATIGPANKAGVMLSGHTDVVPVDGQDWTNDPFTLTQQDGLLIGRGSTDMKGFIASALAAVPAMISTPLKTPIHLAFSYDEEVGCLGVRRLIDMMHGLPMPPALGIIGEPSSMHPVIAHKGKTAFSVTVQGVAGHSAYTAFAVNAVEYAARLVTSINELHRQRAIQGPFDTGYKVPHTTLHVGTISGGTALNIVPASCEFRFEIRNIPEDDPQGLVSMILQRAAQLEEEMQACHEDARINIDKDSSYPGLSTGENHAAVRFVQSLIESDASPGKVSFGTEAGLFSDSLGIPCVVCGPGDIAQAHKPDEFISIEQLGQCDQLMQNLVKRCRQEL